MTDKLVMFLQCEYLHMYICCERRKGSKLGVPVSRFRPLVVFGQLVCSGGSFVVGYAYYNYACRKAGPYWGPRGILESVKIIQGNFLMKNGTRNADLSFAKSGGS